MAEDRKPVAWIFPPVPKWLYPDKKEQREMRAQIAYSGEKCVEIVQQRRCFGVPFQMFMPVPIYEDGFDGWKLGATEPEYTAAAKAQHEKWMEAEISGENERRWKERYMQVWKDQGHTPEEIAEMVARDFPDAKPVDPATLEAIVSPIPPQGILQNFLQLPPLIGLTATFLLAQTPPPFCPVRRRSRF